MAFPQVAASNTNADTVSDTSHTINLPAGISSGDLLIAAIAGSGLDGAPNSAITDWTRLKDLVGGSAQCHLAVFYRIADGNEGATVTATTDLAEVSANFSYRITGWHGTTPPEISTGATGESLNPDPDSLTPSWGAEDTLWIEIVGGDRDADVSAYSTNYDDNQITESTGDGVSDASIAAATRELNATSDDPGTLTFDAADKWMAVTVAVRPAAGGGASSILPLVAVDMANMADMRGMRG